MNSKIKNQFTSTKDVVVFLVIFLAVSLMLYTLYIFFGDYYLRIVALAAQPLLSIFGYKVIMGRLVLIRDEISLNLIVFLSLVIATWKIPVIKRLKAAGWGFLILTAGNSIVAFLTFLSAHKGSESLWTGTEFLNITINFFVAILLWFILLPIKSHLSAIGNHKK
jgi:hypothetical protein